MPLDLQYVDETIDRVGREPEAVIPILQALQDYYGYLPEEALRKVCDNTRITPAFDLRSFVVLRHFPAQTRGQTHRARLPRHRLPRYRGRARRGRPAAQS